MNMTVINTNVNALVAASSLNTIDKAMSKAMTELSTGTQLASSANNAAGSAIVNRMTAQINGLNQAIKNANDGINMLQTADGATNAVVSILQRMRELAVQAHNGTYSSSDKTNMNTEFTKLSGQITQIATATKWNGLSILSSSTASGKSYTLQVGADSTSGNTTSVTIGGFTLKALGLSTLTSVSASGALSTLSSALDTVGNAKATIGAEINILNYTVDNLTQISTNVSQSKSAISDTDYSAATSELSRTQIIKQASTAMLAQANQQPQTVLTLLK
jgi:flagellin